LKRTLQGAIAVCVLPLVVFVCDLNVGWVLHDDFDQIVNNPFIRSFSHVGRILTTDVWGATAVQMKSGIYRPVFMLSLLFNQQIFGNNPLFFHLVNNLIHAANAVLLYLLVRRWLSQFPALFAALLFALHPISVEAVAWVSARPELLVMFFSLTYLHFWLLWDSVERNRGKRIAILAGLVLSAILGFCSKEQFLLVPLGAVLLGWKRKIVPLITVVALMIGLVVWRQWLLQQTAPAFSPIWFSNFGILIARFLTIFFDPSEADLFYPISAAGLLLHLLSLSMIAVWLIYARRRSEILLSAVLFFSPILLLSTVIDLEGVIGDRYFYLCLAGFSIWVASILHSVFQFRPTWLVVFGTVWLLMLTSITLLRVEDWKSEERLLMKASSHYPSQAQAPFVLARYYLRKGDRLAEVRWYEEAVRREPNMVWALNSLAVRKIEMRDFDAAKTLLNRALSSGPTSPSVRFNVGFYYESRGDVLNARRWYQKTLDVSPGHDKAKIALERLK
jgi:protein O-mannosyl-transferase